MATEIPSDSITSDAATPRPKLRKRGDHQPEPGQMKKRKILAENTNTNSRVNQREPPIDQTAPKANSARINIVHSFGKVTTHDVGGEMQLFDLFHLHHSNGGRKPCPGLALQQRGRSEWVGGSRYWISTEGPILKYFWDELDTRRVSETDWTFVDGKAWLACTYDSHWR